jgi:Kelch motif
VHRLAVAVALLSAACSSSVQPSAPLPLTGTWQYLSRNSALERDSANYAWTGRELFDWGGSGFCENQCNNGGLLDPATRTWRTIATEGGPIGRRLGFAAWTGREVFLWSGRDWVSDGALFDPATNSWRPLPPPTASLQGRIMGTTVWTGQEVIVWGGIATDTTASLVHFGDGARYDATANTWRPVSTIGAPTARARHAAVWTGTKMIIWGGETSGRLLGDGAAYDPTTDTWTPISSAGAPSAREDSAAVWTGTEMIILAGREFIRDGARYDPATDSWKSLTIPAPAGFMSRGAVWNGSKVLTWGWLSGNESWGGLYDPATDTWERMNQSPTELAPRVPDVVVWTGAQMLLWGGTSWDEAALPYADGALFTP